MDCFMGNRVVRDRLAAHETNRDTPHFSREMIELHRRHPGLPANRFFHGTRWRVALDTALSPPRDIARPRNVVMREARG
jgi:hypothetical protein